MFAHNKQNGLLRNTNKQAFKKSKNNNLGGKKMRTINLLIGVMLVLNLASCSNSNDDLSSQTSLFE